MTEHQPGSREWAEAEARKGAKVRLEHWDAESWVTFRNGLVFWNRVPNSPTVALPLNRSGWSLYEPAPAQAPDLAARLAELERRFEAHDHCAVCGKVVDTREVSEGGGPDGCQVTSGAWVCSPECEDKLPPTFTTSRKPDPAPGVMGDDEIVKAAFVVGCKGADPFRQVVLTAHEAIRLTRASDKAAREARTEALLQAIKAIALVCPEAREMARAALAAYEGEG